MLDASLWYVAIGLLVASAVISVSITVALFRLFAWIFPHAIAAENN